LPRAATRSWRRWFASPERVHIGRAVEEVLGERRGGDQSGKNSTLPPGEKKRQVAAKKAGFGNDRTYRQAKEIVEKAEANPKKFGPVLDQMNRTSKVGGACIAVLSP